MKKKASREVADFLRFRRFERRLAPMTCSAYERDVFACLAYLEAEGIELAEVQVTHLRAFLASEHERTPAVSRQARTTAALKCFFRFLVEEDSPGASAAPSCSPGLTTCAQSAGCYRRSGPSRYRGAIPGTRPSLPWVTPSLTSTGAELASLPAVEIRTASWPEAVASALALRPRVPCRPAPGRHGRW